MDIQRLYELSKIDVKASKRTAIGFKERLKSHNDRFKETSKSITLSNEQLNRTYGIYP